MAVDFAAAVAVVEGVDAAEDHQYPLEDCQDLLAHCLGYLLVLIFFGNSVTRDVNKIIRIIIQPNCSTTILMGIVKTGDRFNSMFFIKFFFQNWGARIC